MKKILVILCILPCCLLFAACGNKDNENLSTTVPGKTTTVIEKTTTSVTEPPASGDAITSDKKLDEAFTAIKEAYGESYYPNFAIDEEYLKQIYGVIPSDCEAYIGEMPMISANVDTFLGIKAAKDKAATVEKAIRDYSANQISSSMQYPANIARVENAVIYVKGDYIFYFILGDTFEEKEGDKEEAAGLFYQEQGKIGIKALDKLFK